MEVTREMYNEMKRLWAEAFAQYEEGQKTYKIISNYNTEGMEQIKDLNELVGKMIIVSIPANYGNDIILRFADDTFCVFRGGKLVDKDIMWSVEQ